MDIRSNIENKNILIHNFRGTKSISKQESVKAYQETRQAIRFVGKGCRRQEALGNARATELGESNTNRIGHKHGANCEMESLQQINKDSEQKGIFLFKNLSRLKISTLRFPPISP